MLESDGRCRKRRRAWNEPGHAHELTFSCLHRWPLLAKNRTRKWFIVALDRARRRWHFELWAYVIMPEHVHVLLWPRSPMYEMALVLKAIKQSVSRRAVAFLRTYSPAWLERLKVTWPSGREEYRFWEQGGGYDRNVIREDAAWTVIEYIHNNPVRRGLAATPTDWEWSSARWYAGVQAVRLAMDAAPPPLLPGHTRRGPPRR